MKQEDRKESAPGGQVGDPTPPATKLSSGELAARYDRAWGPQAERILSSFRIPEADRPDLLQEVFTHLYLRRKDITNYEHWFMVALRNRCRRYHRDRAVAGRAAAVEAERAARETGRRRPSRELEAHLIMENLPPRQAALLYGRFFAGKSYEELAAQFGITAASLRRSVLRILSRLRRAKRPVSKSRP